MDLVGPERFSPGVESPCSVINGHPREDIRNPGFDGEEFLICVSHLLLPVQLITFGPKSEGEIAYQRLRKFGFVALVALWPIDMISGNFCHNETFSP